MDIMEVNAINLVFGALLNDAGYVKFTWNSDGTLGIKELFVDNTESELIYRKTFFWNADGTLNRWELLIQTTGQVITKQFTWDSDGLLLNNETG